MQIDTGIIIVCKLDTSNTVCIYVLSFFTPKSTEANTTFGTCVL